MNHQKAREQFMAYLAGRLLEPDRITLQQHLAACAECQQELDALRETGTWLVRSVTAAAVQIAAPPDAWDRFEARLARHNIQHDLQRNRGRRPMEQTIRPSRHSMWMRLGLAAAAAVFLAGTGITALILLSGGPGPSGDMAEGNNSTATPSQAGPDVTETASATLSPEQIYLTARPQSGGGSGQPEGSSGEDVPLVWSGTVRSIDPAAGTLTLDPEGQVARIMPFTIVRVEDITWDGALGTVDDIQPGDLVQVDLLDAEPSQPYARVIWIRRPVDRFYESMTYEVNAGTISSLDPATGIFTVDIWEDRQFRYDDNTQMLVDDDTLDGTPIGTESLQIGQMLTFVNLTDQGEPQPVVQIIVEPVNANDGATLYKGRIRAVDGNVLTVAVEEIGETSYSLDLGPAGTQGISFVPGDVIYFLGYHDPANGTFVTLEVIRLSTGEWLRTGAAPTP